MPNRNNKIIEEILTEFSGKTFYLEKQVKEFWLKALTRALTQARKEERADIVEMVEGMKKEHREFECNGAYGGKGCYETWCDIETCTSKDAIECKAGNQALDDLIKKLKEE